MKEDHAKEQSSESEKLIQVVAKDNIQNILIVVTWDCANNKEYSMFQHKGERHSSAENYVVRGFNERLNYFMDENHITDLEYRVPL